MISLSAPRLTQVKAGTGMAVSNASGPTATVTNTGVVTLTEGDNITIENPSTGEYVINASGGSSTSGITQISSGGGLSVTNATGPHTTITNTGVLALQGSDNVTVTDLGSGTWSVESFGVTGVSGGTGISVTDASGPTVSIANTGVVALSSGTNTTVSNSGTTWQVHASSGITTIAGGSGMFVSNGTGPIVSVANTGVVALENGNNTTVSHNGTTWKVDVDVPSSTTLVNGTYTTAHQNSNTEWQVNVNTANMQATDTFRVDNMLLTADLDSGSSYENRVTSMGQGLISKGGSGTTHTLVLTTKNTDSSVDTGIQLFAGSLKLLCRSDDTNKNCTMTLDADGFEFDVVPTTSANIDSSDSSSKFATTEWVSQKIISPAFTTAYTSNTYITIPGNCRAFGVVALSQGGRAGASKWGFDSDQASSGGSGGGGTCVILPKLLTYKDQLIKVEFNNNNSNGSDYVKVRYTNGSSSAPTSSSSFTTMCEVYSGGDGGDAYESIPGTGIPLYTPGDAGASPANPYLNTTFGTWTTYKGTAGNIGKVVTIPYTSSSDYIPVPGRPVNCPYVDGARGCGQSYEKDTSSSVSGQPESTSRGLGAVWITFYYS